MENFFQNFNLEPINDISRREGSQNTSFTATTKSLHTGYTINQYFPIKHFNNANLSIFSPVNKLRYTVCT